MSFDAASVKPFQISGPIPVSPMTRPPTLFSLGPDDAKPPGGRFYARFGLGTYIGFAYKLAAFQTSDAVASAPKWLRTDRYEIEAETKGNPTKDQMRLMMQSLLTDRFKLKVHNEVHQVHVLALVLSKPGRTGPSLQPHPMGDSSCSSAYLPRSATDSASSQPASVAGGFPVGCGGLVLMPVSTPNSVKVGAR